MRCFPNLTARHLMRMILSWATIVCLAACNKKEGEPIYPPEVLLAHEWYPYKTQIVKVDSITTVTRDATGNVQVQNTVTQSDSAFVLSGCLQQSTYHFQQNGVVTIKDQCSTTGTDITSSWFITQTNMLSFPFAPHALSGYSGFVPGSGQVIKIDHSEFVFNTLSQMYWFKETNGPNGARIGESHKLYITESITYRSK